MFERLLDYMYMVSNFGELEPTSDMSALFSLSIAKFASSCKHRDYLIFLICHKRIKLNECYKYVTKIHTMLQMIQTNVLFVYVEKDPYYIIVQEMLYSIYYQ